MSTYRFWHVGNWCIHTGQKYIESPFLGPTKGVEILNYAEEFVDSLRDIPDSEVISEPSWDLYNMSPEAFEERLSWATCIIFGDVETKCLMLHPDFFNRNKWTEGYVTFPDRFEILRDWVAKGGHFHMNGGWYSFGGELGKGGWGRSVFHDALPVVCREGDDLIESTSSYMVRTQVEGHAVMSGIDVSEIPPILGFNQTTLRPGAEALLEIHAWGEWHPLLAGHHVGKGKVTAFTTSASPHWGINLVKWPQYRQLWAQLFTRY
ncbi:glutamine amidotransferase [Fulvivirga sedimenti]|uniref:Glutamine amidotransferase n=1 Tax=Fulvivirga sedimenti TaxID=2879465 RepID=A0A9X1HTQ1_9BACT|nr:glutamine amidotransferase [Fulvivirga sedimenti]MCA6078118.1 glutamine amidotransferase [Fulvivirga sedimenti]